MQKVRIVTDSTSCLLPELLKKYDITVVPMGVLIDGKRYDDQVDITVEKFWKMFYATEKPITTSPPSPGVFTTKLEETARTCENIVCILVSKALTSAQNVAELAAKNVIEGHPKLHVEIFDSKTSTGAMGFIAIEAAKAARQGKDVEDVMKVASDMAGRVKFVSMMQTMKYLARLGRAPQGVPPEMLAEIKPFIGMLNGSGLVENIGQVKGQEAGMERLVALVGEHADIRKPLHVIVHYSDRLEDGERLRKMIADKYHPAELYMSPYTPIMTAAVGPVLAIGFYS